MNSIFAPFPSAPLPGDVNLLPILTQQLADAGHPNPQAWLQDPHVQFSADKNSLIQRTAVCDYWRNQLLSLRGVDTQLPRFFLNVDEPHDKFVAAFEKLIVPLIVAHQLGL